VTPGVFNCGSGRATSFNEIADAVRSGLGRTGDDAATEYFEMPPNVRAFYQDFTCADLSETQDALDWSPRFDPVSSIAEYAAHIAQRRSR
jgi:ADP-L-glycero-D-manno-heptose 6-epimerase